MLAVRTPVYLFATVVYSVELSLKDTKKARQRLIFPRYIDLNVKHEARLTSHSVNTYVIHHTNITTEQMEMENENSRKNDDLSCPTRARLNLRGIFAYNILKLNHSLQVFLQSTIMSEISTWIKH